MARPILQKVLRDGMELFTEGWRALDPATASAVDLLLLDIAQAENNLRSDMLGVTDPEPLTVVQLLERVEAYKREFLFLLGLFAEDYPQQWEYLFGKALTSKVIFASLPSLR